MAVVAAAAASGCAVGATGSPTEVSVGGATVAGKVTSSVGGTTSYWAEFGTTTAYGRETAHESVVLEKDVPRGVSLRLLGLERATRYHYRVCAADSEQDQTRGVCGADRSFVTQSVTCGQTITADVRLTGNLDCFEGTGPQEGTSGLVIGADGLDVNLAGYNISGEIFVGGGDIRGIDNAGGYDDLVVRNGSLGGWGYGIYIEGASRNAIRDVAAQGSPTGVWISGGAQNEIRRSDILGRTTGIEVQGEQGLAVTDSEVFAGFSVAMAISGDGGLIARNRVETASSKAISVAGSSNRVLDNDAIGGTSGVIFLGSGSDNVISGNDVSEGVLVFPGETGSSNGDGIFINSGVAGTLVRDNLAHDNDGDGIDVQSAGTRLRDNRAQTNGLLGIRAVAGVVDLGGNTASGNGNPLQCVNVFCQ